MSPSHPDGYLALPPNGKGQPVLVLHAWWGLNAAIKTFCDRLASEGFVAFALDLYHGQVADTIAGAEVLGGTLDGRYEEALAEVTQAVTYLSELYDISGQGVALVAFSLGVYYALEQSNADPEHVSKVVTFYGSRDGDYNKSKAAYLGHFAEHDVYELPAAIDAMAADLAQANRPYTFHTYSGTGHWFFEPDRVDAYDPVAAELAWKRTVSFLQE
ncbi:MAG: dienelactone hydrolase family protein [Anaerolineaceae bacterium]|nr:dienelactone hydrolase family protein [Anaerolineaceae bacterium]